MKSMNIMNGLKIAAGQHASVASRSDLSRRESSGRGTNDSSAGHQDDTHLTLRPRCGVGRSPSVPPAEGQKQARQKPRWKSDNEAAARWLWAFALPSPFPIWLSCGQAHTWVMGWDASAAFACSKAHARPTMVALGGAYCTAELPRPLLQVAARNNA